MKNKTQLLYKEKQKGIIREFLVKYSQAQFLERQGSHVIVWMDESYINSNHYSKKSWYLPTDPESNYWPRPSGKGPRLIIVHAITAEGFLNACDPLEIPYRPDGHVPVESEFSSCEWIWKAGKATGDYHKNMDSFSFLNWVKYRLMPTFKKRFPDKKIVLILDNASYHHCKGPTYLNFKTCTREKLVSFYKKHIQRHSFESERNGKKFVFYVKETKRGKSIYSFGKQGSKTRPNKNELAFFVKKWVQ